MASYHGVESICTANSRIAHYTITRDALEGVPPFEDADEWYQVVWDEVEERGYVFLRASYKYSGGSVHLPREFPDGECPHEPGDAVSARGTNPVLCRECDVDSFVAKPTSVLPVGYYDVCSYCMYEFVTWWLETNDHGDLI